MSINQAANQTAANQTAANQTAANQAAGYRRRARSLRTLAETIEGLPLMRLDALAGPDTWHGPVPADRVDRLRQFQFRLHGDIEELRRRAWWLDQQAEELERAATLPGIA